MKILHSHKNSLDLIIEQLNKQEAELHSALQLISMHKQNLLAAADFLKVHDLTYPINIIEPIDSTQQLRLTLDEKNNDSVSFLSHSEHSEPKNEVKSEVTVEALITFLNNEVLDYVGVDYTAKRMNVDRSELILAIAKSAGKIELQSKNGYEHMVVPVSDRPSRVDNTLSKSKYQREKGYHNSLPNNEIVNGDRSFSQMCNKFLIDTKVSFFTHRDLFKYMYSDEQTEEWTKEQIDRYTKLISTNLGQSIKSPIAKYCRDKKGRRGVYQAI